LYVKFADGIVNMDHVFEKWSRLCDRANGNHEGIA